MVKTVGKTTLRKQAHGLIDSISVICWNIRGLRGKLEQCDIAEFLFEKMI